MYRVSIAVSICAVRWEDYCDREIAFAPLLPAFAEKTAGKPAAELLSLPTESYLSDSVATRKEA